MIEAFVDKQRRLNNNLQEAKALEGGSRRCVVGLRQNPGCDWAGRTRLRSACDEGYLKNDIRDGCR